MFDLEILKSKEAFQSSRLALFNVCERSNSVGRVHKSELSILILWPEKPKLNGLIQLEGSANRSCPS